MANSSTFLKNISLEHELRQGVTVQKNNLNKKDLLHAEYVYVLYVF